MTTTTAPLPRRTKIIFGLGDWGPTTTGTAFMFFFAFFLTDVARLEPAYAGLVLLIGGIWDAINDPLVGLLADRVHTRWGRRRPFFLFGALPYALTITLLWWTPPLDRRPGQDALLHGRLPARRYGGHLAQRPLHRADPRAHRGLRRAHPAQRLPDDRQHGRRADLGHLGAHLRGPLPRAEDRLPADGGRLRDARRVALPAALLRDPRAVFHTRFPISPFPDF